MSKRIDAALKRAIQRGWDKPSEAPSFSLENIHAELVNFVRREKAQAFEEGESGGWDANPYRGRARR